MFFLSFKIFSELKYSLESGENKYAFSINDGFFCFNFVSDTIVTEKSENKQQDQIARLSSKTEIPQPKFFYGEYDAEWWRNGLIGRHQMVSIESSEYLDEVIVQKNYQQPTNPLHLKILNSNKP